MLLVGNLIQNAETQEKEPLLIKIGAFPACDNCGTDQSPRYKVFVSRGKNCRTFFICKKCRDLFRENKESVLQFFEKYFEPYSYFHDQKLARLEQETKNQTVLQTQKNSRAKP